MSEAVDRAKRASCPRRYAEHYESRRAILDPVEVARVAFVAVAALLVWFHVWEPLAAL